MVDYREHIMFAYDLFWQQKLTESQLNTMIKNINHRENKRLMRTITKHNIDVYQK